MKKVITTLLILAVLIGVAAAGYTAGKDTYQISCGSETHDNLLKNDKLYTGATIWQPENIVVTDSQGHPFGEIAVEANGDFTYTAPDVIPIFPVVGNARYLVAKPDGSGPLSVGATITFDASHAAPCDLTETEPLVEATEPHDYACDSIDTEILGVNDGQEFHVGDSVSVGSDTYSTIDPGCIRCHLEVNGVATGTGLVTFPAAGEYLLEVVAESCDGTCKASDTAIVTAI